MRRTLNHHAGHLVAVVLFLLSGCGGMDFGGDIQIPDNQQHVLGTGSPDTDQIRLPGDRTFNIHLKTSSQNPGTDGSAQGHSDTTAAGDAFCEVTAARGGSATADFKLGHQLGNQTGKQQNVAIQVEFELGYTIQASRLPASQTTATGNLNLVILDARNRAVNNLPICQLSSDTAAATSSTTQRHNLTAVFEPGQTYSIMLSGQVKGSTATDQEATARLAVKGLRMRLTFSPAPPSTNPASSRNS